MKTAVVSAVIFLSLLLLSGTDAEASRQLDRLPRLVIWSWQHDDDLSFLKSDQAVVAYYAGTIILGRDVATFQSRKNRLVIPQDVARFPVFRVENAHRHEAPTARALGAAGDIIISCCQKEKVKPVQQVQIDYDATEDERQAYLVFLRQLKRRLPSNVSISITALSSWCLSDKWLNAAPVDETVAMMFTMGRGKREVLDALKHEMIDSGAPCEQSLGISVSENNTNAALHNSGSVDRASKIYAFSPLGWNTQRYDEILSEVCGH